jgi:multicomponent Na+:H+ antiporter subunit G
MIELLLPILGDLLEIALVAIGVLFMLLSTFGLLRMPDTYGRLHAAGKAGTLGVICILLASGLHIGTLGAVLRALALVVLFYVTAPVATHMIGRVVWRAGGHPECD